MWMEKDGKRYRLGRVTDPIVGEIQYAYPRVKSSAKGYHFHAEAYEKLFLNAGTCKEVCVPFH